MLTYPQEQEGNRDASVLVMNQKGSLSKTVKKKEDALFEPEQQFILRLPAGPAMALRHDVQSGAMNLKDKLSIEIAADARHGKVTYGGQIFNAKLVDLPCIIESLKTTDRKNFFKTADICQMLVCMEDEYESPDESDHKKKDKDKRYLWNHGICPSMKNVRRRRFRKTLQKKYQDQPDIENEVRRLFRADGDAVDVKWEIIYEQHDDGESKLDDLDASSTAPTDIESRGIDVTGERRPAVSFAEIAEHEIFGEVSSSDEDEVNILDSGDEMESRLHVGDMKEPLLSIDFGFAEAAASYDPDLPEWQNRLHELNSQLESLQERRVMREMELSITEQSSQKEKLQRELDDLIEEQNKRKQEYEILSSMLNQDG